MFPLRPRLPARAHRRRLIVIEKDAPSVSFQGTQTFEEAVVIAQRAGETASELASRALHRITLAERTGLPFHEAFLCTADTDESATRAARRLMALAIAAHADAAHSLNELVLCAPSGVGLAQRDALVRLADDAVLAGKDKPLRVCLCFVEEEPRLVQTCSEELPEARVA